MLLPKTEEKLEDFHFHICVMAWVCLAPSPYILLILLYRSEGMICLNLQLQATFYYYPMVTMTGALS